MTTAAITENSSEKPKRGRPRLYPAAYEAVFRIDAKHHRSGTNGFYRSHALNALGFGQDDVSAEARERYSWLFDLQADSMKRTILAELGQVGNAEAIRTYAGQLCEMKPKTREAVLMLR